MLTNRTFSTKAYDARYFETLDEGTPKPPKLGHGYNRLERKLIKALRDARALLCSEGDPDEDGAMIEKIDTLLKQVEGR
jgi:hypothetical protein